MNESIEILKQETYVDKSTWPNRGEWDNESDKLHFVDKATDIDCLIVRGPVGALCGYVAVEPNHPAYLANYNRVQVDVHGGLTYASLCAEDGKICHVPRLGRPHDVYWLGFDCAHRGDLSPSYESRFIGLHGSYRNLHYVINEVQSLARQLAKREPLRAPYDWEDDD